MGLLARYRRLLGARCCSPRSPCRWRCQTLQPGGRPSSDDEARMLSAAPAWPRSHAAMARAAARARPLPRRSLRAARRAGARARRACAMRSICRATCASSSAATTGCFSTATARSSRRPASCCAKPQIAKFADRAAALHAQLAAKGARLLVAIPPNGSTINRARLPAWAADAPSVTEYDLMMRALTERGVAAVDLRPPLSPRMPASPIYRRTDTHWNRLGALVAYNAVVEAAAQARLDHRSRARAARLRAASTGGDLARLLAVVRRCHRRGRRDRSRALRPGTASPHAARRRSSRAAAIWSRPAAPGPTVLVIGDSFTRGFWQDYFALHAGRYVWMHHELCGFRLSA